MTSSRRTALPHPKRLITGLTLARIRDYGSDGTGHFRRIEDLSRETLRALEREKPQLAVERFKRDMAKARDRLAGLIEKNREITKLRIESQFSPEETAPTNTADAAPAPRGKQKREITY